MVKNREKNTPSLAGDIKGRGERGVTEFLDRFGASDSQRKAFRPLFLALSSSSSGELATSIGIFERDGRLYEVSGTECSVWDFNGQFTPEPSSVPELRHRTAVGTLGRSDSDHSDIYASELLLFLDSVASDFPVSEPTLHEEFSMSQDAFQLWHIMRMGPHAAFDHPILRKDSKWRERFAKVFESRLLDSDSILPRRNDEGLSIPEDASVYALGSGSLRVFLGLGDCGFSGPSLYSSSDDLLSPGNFQALSFSARQILDDAEASVDLGEDLTGDCEAQSPAPQGPRP